MSEELQEEGGREETKRNGSTARAKAVKVKGSIAIVREKPTTTDNRMGVGQRSSGSCHFFNISRAAFRSATASTCWIGEDFHGKTQSLVQEDGV